MTPMGTENEMTSFKNNCSVSTFQKWNAIW